MWRSIFATRDLIKASGRKVIDDGWNTLVLTDLLLPDGEMPFVTFDGLVGLKDVTVNAMMKWG